MLEQMEQRALFAFPGLHYFEDNEVDRKLFFGREQEIEQLVQRILAEDLTVLFGKSGEGKTSLINAGLKKAFRELGYLPVRARVFNVAAKQTPLEALYQDLAKEAQTNHAQLPEHWQKRTLWETFTGLRPSAENNLKPIVLILDQFEELFTLLAGRPEEQEEFIRQFADLVRGRIPEELRETYREQLRVLPPESAEARELEKLLYATVAPPVRILLSLREDYLALLDHLSSRIPKVFGSRYRLPSLSIEQAREAITNPPQQAVLGEAAFSIAPAAVEAILQFLTAQSRRLGGSEELVGPPQLQVLCRQLEEQMRQKGKRIIEVEDLGGEKGMRQLLSRYYRGILARFPRLRFGSGPRRLSGFGLVRRVQPVHSPRFAVRCLCEERLITSAGNRNSRHEEEIIREIGVVKGDLEKLVDSRLLRREPRLQESFYELSHDSLVPSLQAAGGLRKAWMTSLKFAAIAALAFVVINWGVPFVQSFFAMDTLRAEFEEVQAGKMRAVYFRERLFNMRSFVRDTTSLAKLHEEFDDWRQQSLHNAILALPAEQNKRADSLLTELKREYPNEASLTNALTDSLGQRLLRRFEQRYNSLVTAPVGDILATEALLDSANFRFSGNARVTAMRENWARHIGEVSESLRLQQLRRAQEQTAIAALEDALKLREPRNGVAQGDSSGRASQFELVLENNPALQGARLLLNGEEMKRQVRDKERYYAGLVRVPQRVREVEVEIRAIDKDGNSGWKTFTIKIDRAPPRVLSHKIFYRENEKEEWQNMPSGEWRGKEWRITVQASEPLQSPTVVLLMSGMDMKVQQAPSLADEIVPGTLSNEGRDATFSKTSETILNAQEVEAIVRLQDFAGWQSSINLGKWKVAKAPAQEVQQTTKPNAPPEKFLSAEEVRAMIQKNDFYCKEYDWTKAWSNPKGKGITNDFVLENKGQVVFDRAMGLRWQQAGSARSMTFAQAQENVADMNRQKFSGYEDWRLPTLEEAMSLMEPKKTGDLYIDKIFAREQWWIWTSDKSSGSSCWVALFSHGSCYGLRVDSNYYVRLVR